jgi:hypothetical protein
MGWGGGELERGRCLNKRHKICSSVGLYFAL